MNAADTQLVRELCSLEKKLLDPHVRASPSEVAAMLADDFLEFGRSGRIYDRSKVIETIAASPIGPVEVQDFQARLLAPGVALATFRTVRHGNGGATLRSSIWLRTSAGWRLLFHQGTPAASPE